MVTILFSKSQKSLSPSFWVLVYFVTNYSQKFHSILKGFFSVLIIISSLVWPSLECILSIKACDSPMQRLLLLSCFCTFACLHECLIQLLAVDWQGQSCFGLLCATFFALLFSLLFPDTLICSSLHLCCHVALQFQQNCHFGPRIF